MPFFFSFYDIWILVLNDCRPPKPNAFLPEQKKTKIKIAKKTSKIKTKKGKSTILATPNFYIQ